MGYYDTPEERRKYREERARRRQEARKRRAFHKAMGSLALALFFAILPFQAIRSFASYSMHKSSVEFGEVQMVGTGVYKNGENAIDFSITVTTEKYEVSDIFFHTTVFKDGKYLGYISTQLDENIPENTTQTLHFYYLEPNRQWASDIEFFDALYNAEEGEYTFVLNLLGVGFTDGVMVGRYSLLWHEYEYDENGEIIFYDE